MSKGDTRVEEPSNRVLAFALLGFLVWLGFAGVAVSQWWWWQTQTSVIAKLIFKVDYSAIGQAIALLMMESAQPHGRGLGQNPTL